MKQTTKDYLRELADVIEGGLMRVLIGLAVFAVIVFLVTGKGWGEGGIQAFFTHTH